jgi:hypothetical protein
LPAEAGTRRALLVGVADYGEKASAHDAPSAGVGASAPTPAKAAVGRKWQDLDGPVNDVVAMRAMLVGRFGFAPGDVAVLVDAAASREAVLRSLRRLLLEEGAPGDDVLFFFAGHGSLVRNSASAEADKADETLVPADARAGAPDIRDKELALLLDAGAARGTRVTVILDACHSGSATRGLVPAKVRRLEPEPGRDVADPEPSPDPAARGVLVLAAAQDTQGASETRLESGVVHGAFTAALLRGLRTLPPGASAEAVFLSARAALQTSGSPQEPVLHGTAARRSGPIFAADGTAEPGARLAVLRRVDGGVELQGGLALGIGPGSELQSVTGRGPPLVVSEAPGPATCLARPAAPGTGLPEPGDVYRVERWAAPVQAAVVVHMGDGSLEASQVAAAAAALGPLRGSAAIRWVEDPAATPADVIVLHRAGGWRLETPDGRGASLGTRPTRRAVLGALGRVAPGQARPRLLVRLPAPREIVLALGHAGPGGVVRVADRDAEAQYLLAGRVAPAGAQYAWVLAAGPGGDPGALPRRTDWRGLGTGGGAEAASSLHRDALRLARVSAWLRIESPPDDGAFPYELVLEDVATGAQRTGGVVREGERYQLVLKLDEARLRPRWVQRFAYVLLLDASGSIRVLVPEDKANVENKVPILELGEVVSRPPGRVALRRRGSPLTVGPPFGVDTYILVASEQAIPALEYLEQDGADDGEIPPAARGSSLASVLLSAGRYPRGPAPTSGWSLQRLQVRSEPRGESR